MASSDRLPGLAPTKPLVRGLKAPTLPDRLGPAAALLCIAALSLALWVVAASAYGWLFG